MHGVRRDQQQLAHGNGDSKELEKIEVYRQLLKDLSVAENAEAVLNLSRQVLLMNPESYQTWNLRKRALLSSQTLGDEFSFNVDTIKLNPKSYNCWYHRRWLISTFFLEGNNDDKKQIFDWRFELKLCAKLLSLDPRNCTSFIQLLFSNYHGV